MLRPRGQTTDVDRGSHVHLFAEAVANIELWAYMAMICSLVGVFSHVTAWVQSCPCHRGMGPGADAHDPEADAEASLAPFFKCPNCPLRGRRAPELARGGFHQFLRGLREQFGLPLLEEVVIVGHKGPPGLRCVLTRVADVSFRVLCKPYELGGLCEHPHELFMFFLSPPVW